MNPFESKYASNFFALYETLKNFWPPKNVKKLGQINANFPTCGKKFVFFDPH